MKKADCMVDLSPYAALFKDIAAWDVGLLDALSRDLSWIEHVVSSRGMSFIMIDMPEGCKVLDFSLSRGHLDSSTLPKTFGKIVNKGSRTFLGSLFRKCFDEDGVLMDSVSAHDIFFLRTTLSLCKKVKKDCSDATLIEAITDFQTIDNRLRYPTLEWGDDCLGPMDRELSFADGLHSSQDMFTECRHVPRPLIRILDDVTRIVSSTFPEVIPEDVRPSHGPGAVADAPSKCDKYHIPNWPSKLEGFFPFCLFGQSREDMHLTESIIYGNQELPAKLHAVPKTLKTPRIIASEPVGHMYLQLGMMDWLRENLPHQIRSSINFLDQEPSRATCLRASLDGSLATVDLSSASDRLSCWVVERALRGNQSLVRALHACRTRWLVNSTGYGEHYYLRLRKYAAQGNGTTFPVQTIVYTMICIAVLLYERGVKVTSRNIKKAAKDIRVYGDDIMIPSPAVPTLALLLSYLDLKVNVSKTHYSGKFRESCGMDAYNGVEVTPLYLSSLELGSSADALQSWVDVSNNAYSKGLLCLSDWMVQQIPQKIRALIPRSNKVLGCITLLSHDTPLYRKTRVNRVLQRLEVLALCVRTKVSRGQRESHANLLQYFVEDPSPATQWAAGWLSRKRLTLVKRWVSIY
jgi:hypothetical protein